MVFELIKLKIKSYGSNFQSTAKRSFFLKNAQEIPKHVPQESPRNDKHGHIKNDCQLLCSHDTITPRSRRT